MDASMLQQQNWVFTKRFFIILKCKIFPLWSFTGKRTGHYFILIELLFHFSYLIQDYCMIYFWDVFKQYDIKRFDIQRVK